jgi:hypothetical protein
MPRRLRLNSLANYCLNVPIITHINASSINDKCFVLPFCSGAICYLSSDRFTGCLLLN